MPPSKQEPEESCNQQPSGCRRSRWPQPAAGSRRCSRHPPPARSRASAAHHGAAQRPAEAARRADHEGVERRHRRALQSDHPGARCSASGSTISFYYLRWRTSVPTGLNEFAILIIGRRVALAGRIGSRMRRYAAKAGLSADVIADLKAGNTSVENGRGRGRRVRFRHRADPTKKVSDETYARAKKIFNDQQINRPHQRSPAIT